LVLNRGAFLELDYSFLWNDFPSLVRRKISLVTVAIRGHLGTGGAAVWSALVSDKKQSEAESNTNRQANSKTSESSVTRVVVAYRYQYELVRQRWVRRRPRYPFFG
jgi:hypothetical protein